MVGNILKIALVLSAPFLLTALLVFIIFTINIDIKDADEKKHNEYMKAFSYCYSKNKTHKEFENCINIIMRPR